MPDLPTLTVTDAQAQRLLEVFTDSVDPDTGQALTPQQAYRRWLRDTLVGHVLAQESIRLDQRAAEEKRRALTRLAEDLPPA